MNRENSVLFALRDLRAIQAERVAEERHADEQRLRAAQEEQRRLDEERRCAAEEVRRREEQSRRNEADRSREREALCAAMARNDALQTELLVLREQVTSVPLRPRRAWRISLSVVAGLSAALMTLAALRLTPHERVVYITAPQRLTLPASVAPISSPQRSVAPPQPVIVSKSVLPDTAPSNRRRHKSAPTREPHPPLITDCDGTDPLCGTLLK
jgi:hypothetical protein